jgi:hypothetical protein
VASGVGGTGAGTAVAGGGLLVGPDTTFGKVLLLLSPATSVLAGTLLFYAHMNLRRWLEDREADRARGRLREALHDPDVPEDKKAAFRQLLGEFEHETITRGLERARNIGQVPPPPSHGD